MPARRAHKNKPEAGKMGNPEQDARGEIDQLLVQAGWHVCDADQDATTNQAVCVIFPPEYLDTKYLFWYLRFVRSDLIAQAVGGAQPNISQGSEFSSSKPDKFRHSHQGL